MKVFAERVNHRMKTLLEYEWDNPTGGIPDKNKVENGGSPLAKQPLFLLSVCLQVSCFDTTQDSCHDAQPFCGPKRVGQRPLKL